MKKFNNTLISVRLPRHLHQRVKDFAVQNETSQTEVVRHALRTLVDHD